MRLDLYLTKTYNLTREKSQFLIKHGSISVNNKVINKPSHDVKDVDEVILLEAFEYVGRGGLKLKSAIESFDIQINNKICLDIGASTGGFSDYLLKQGAKYIYAVDIAENEFDKILLKSGRVKLFEKTDINKLNAFDELVDLVVSDVSWLSIKDYILAVKKFCKPLTDLVILLKPQYEVNKNRLWKGKILKDPELRQDTINKVCDWLVANNFIVVATTPSGLAGKEGNIEEFLHLKLV